MPQKVVYALFLPGLLYKLKRSRIDVALCIKVNNGRHFLLLPPRLLHHRHIHPGRTELDKFDQFTLFIVDGKGKLVKPDI
jgi:hypothetical protein